MQFNGIGREHDAQMHHVTTCMHDHSHFKNEVGGAGLKHGVFEAAPSEQAVPEGQFSLSSWLERTFGSGKRILRGFWNGSDTASTEDGENGAATAGILTGSQGEEKGQDRAGHSAMTSPALHNAQIAAASLTVPDNPYFSPVENSGRARETLWQKLKVRCRNVTGQMARHLPGKFFNTQTRGSFQSRQEPPKEDLRRHSKYREDTLEIDCVLTDDSYLLDSYDRKGAYSRLSAKK